MNRTSTPRLSRIAVICGLLAAAVGIAPEAVVRDTAPKASAG